MAWKDGMALIEGVWHYRFNVAGVEHYASTHTGNKTTAKLRRDEAREKARAGAASGQPVFVGRCPKVAEVAEAWFKANPEGVTSERNRAIAGQALKVLGTLAQARVDRINVNTVEEWRAAAIKAGRSPAYTNLAVKYLRTWTNWGSDRGLCPRVNLKKLKAAPVQEKAQPFVPAERVPEFLEAVDRLGTHKQARAFVRVLVGMGLRVSEGVGMRWEGFTKGARWRYRPAETKSNRVRVIPVPLWVQEALEGLSQKSEGFVFAGHGGGPPTRMYARGLIKAAGEAVGVVGLTHHGLRRTFTDLVLSGGESDLKDAQELLGHADIETTMVYAKASAWRLERTASSLDSLVPTRRKLGEAQAD